MSAPEERNAILAALVYIDSNGIHTHDADPETRKVCAGCLVADVLNDYDLGLLPTVEIARCPEHGLHGQRDECFICEGPVEQVRMVPLAAASPSKEDAPG